jgi:hypothetical protein
MSIQSFIRSLTSTDVVVRRVIQPSAEKGAPVGAAEGQVQVEEQRQKVGNFVTPESVATFSGATFAIAFVWNVIEGVLSLPHTLILGLILSALVAYVLYDADANTPADEKAARPRKPIRILCAVVNACFLFSGAAGSHDVAVQVFMHAPGSSAATQSAVASGAPAAALKPQGQ